METEAELKMNERKVHEILERFKLPAEIERVDTVFDVDSSGDRSVELTFHVRDDAQIGKKELERLTKFLSEVTRALLQGNIVGFPYTRLEQRV